MTKLEELNTTIEPKLINKLIIIIETAVRKGDFEIYKPVHNIEEFEKISNKYKLEYLFDEFNYEWKSNDFPEPGRGEDQEDYDNDIIESNEEEIISLLITIMGSLGVIRDNN